MARNDPDFLWPEIPRGESRRDGGQRPPAPSVTRLTAAFWVAAYRKRLDLHGIPCFVARHGDDGSGAVLVKLNTLDGQAKVFQRSFDLMTGERAWIVLAEGPERDCDAACARQAGFDPDIWVLEVEDRAGRHLLDQDGLD